MSNPLVSIIIPCRNAAPWLEECLASAFAQTWAPVEVILIDDGSTDSSLSIAQTFESRGLKIISGAQKNAATARNQGIAASTGEWIQFLDADDLLHPEKIKLQLIAAENMDHPGILSSEWCRFQSDPAEARFDPEPNWKDLTGIEFLRMHFQSGWMMQPAAWLMHRDLIEQFGTWNESLTLNDDGEFFARMMLGAGSIHFCPGAKTYYRSGNQQSLSNQNNTTALESLYRSVELTFSHMENAGASPDTQQAIADGWRWLSFELHPRARSLSLQAEQNSEKYGGSSRPLPGSKKFRYLSYILGWRLARQLTA